MCMVHVTIRTLFTNVHTREWNSRGIGKMIFELAPERAIEDLPLLLDNLGQNLSELVHRVSDVPVGGAERRDVLQPLEVE